MTKMKERHTNSPGFVSTCSMVTLPKKNENKCAYVNFIFINIFFCFWLPREFQSNITTNEYQKPSLIYRHGRELNRRKKNQDKKTVQED